MDGFNVEIGLRAKETYRRIQGAAAKHIDAGDTSHPSVSLLQALHDLVEKSICCDPFSNHRLMDCFCQTYWVSGERLRIYFAASPKPKTVVIICIALTARPIPTEKLADLTMRQMIRCGQVRVAISPPSPVIQ